MATGRKIASLFAEIGVDTSKLDKALAQSKVRLGEFKQSLGDSFSSVTGQLGKFKNVITGTITEMTGISASSLNWAVAIGGSVKLLRDSIKVTTEYADRVRDLSRAIGASAEDSSRFINAADDVFISTEALKTALTAATRQGFKPTIENIKIMADEYMALNPGIERSEYLLKRFGRSGQEMGKLLEQGAAGIDKLMAANERLTLSGADLEGALQLKQAMDSLQDAFMGFQIALAKDIIPTLTEFLNTISEGINVGTGLEKQYDDLKATFRTHVKELETSTLSQKDYNAEIVRSAYLSNALNEKTSRAGAVMRDYQYKMANGIELTRQQRDEYFAILNMLGAVSEKDREYAELIESGILPKHQRLANVQSAQVDSLYEIYVGMGDVEMAMKNVTRGYETAAQAQQRLTREMIFAKVSGSMSPDQALKLAEAWGMVDKKTVETTKAVNAVNSMFDTNKDGIVDSTEATDYYIDRLIELERILKRLDGQEFSAAFVLTELNTGVGVTKYRDMTSFKDKQAEAEGGASGMSFVVPSGYAGDTFPLGGNRYAQTGETVTVTPVGQKPGMTLKNYGTIVVQSADELGTSALKQWR